jgi:putative phosphoesterase
MTRIAIISDVHADVQALADALAQAARLGCDTMVCAGDLVDCGLFPDETIALLQERAIPCIRGNHDRWRVADHAAVSGGYSEGQLAPETLQFLAGLPLEWNGVFDGVRVALRHGTPRSDMDGIFPSEASQADVQRWLEQAQADVLIVGHTHQPFTLSTPSGGMIANPGALLRDQSAQSKLGLVYDPQRNIYALAENTSGGTFGVLELPSCTFKVYRAADGSEVEIPRLIVGVSDTRCS